MTDYREIFNLHSLELNKAEITTRYQCIRNTVEATLHRAEKWHLQWLLPEGNVE